MKKIIFSWLLSMIFLSAATAQRGEERTGFDGDFFSLEGAIDLFKNSNTIADFERRLNQEDTWVNNLDLDRDGQIDFIRVEHIRQGNFHAIVLQVPLNRYDVQDIAVIEIEKTGRRRAMLQIVGDEDIYGEEVIVEPYDTYGYSGGRGGPNADFDFRRGYVNVYWWAPIRHIFGRHYRIYRSPYYWSYYPSYWRPWRPCGWNIFRPRIVIFHRHYHIVSFHRLYRVHNFYRPYRHYSYDVFYRSNQVRVQRGRPALQRERINHGPNRKEFRPGLRKVNNTARINSTAQINSNGSRNKISPPRSIGKRAVTKDSNPQFRTPKSSNGRDRINQSSSPDKRGSINSGRTKSSDRISKSSSGERIKQTVPPKSNRSSAGIKSDRRTNKTSSVRSSKPSRKSYSSRRNSSTRSSKSKARSSSKSSRSQSKASSRSSKKRSSVGASKKSRGRSKASSRSSRSKSSARSSKRSRSSKTSRSSKKRRG